MLQTRRVTCHYHYVKTNRYFRKHNSLLTLKPTNMNWREIVAEDFKNEKFDSVITILKQNIEKNIDRLASTIELIYVHWHIVLEVRKFPYAGKTDEEWFHELNHVYRTYSPQWLDDAEFSFYIAYAGSCFCEGFIGLDEKDIADMFEKAYNMYPDNLIYQWGTLYNVSHEYKEQGKYAEWLKEDQRMAKLILSDNECVQAIKNYPLLGEDLLWLLDIKIKDRDILKEAQDYYKIMAKYTNCNVAD